MLLKFKKFTLNKNCKITYSFNGLQELEFTILENEIVNCEDSFYSNNNKYIVKAINNNVVTCELDLSDFRERFFKGATKFDSMVLYELLRRITNWTVLNAQTKNLRRTLELEDESSLSAMFKIAKLYDCTFEFNAKDKIIKVVDEPRPINLVVSKNINLLSLDVKTDTYEHYTRLYGYGKDDLTFSEINNGLDYVEDLTYSKKIIPAIFRDDRFTNKTNLKEHCLELLSKYSKPVVEYTVKVADISNKHKIKLHDEFILLNHKNKQKEKHRVIELVKYSDKPHLNEITVINKSEVFSEQIQSIEEKITNEITKNVNNEFKSRFDKQLENLKNRFDELLSTGHKIETDEAIYFVDRLPKEDAQNVLKIGVGGILASSNGWGGPYELAISNDGRINLNNASIGALDGQYIRAGTVTFDKLSLEALERIKDGLVTTEQLSRVVIDKDRIKQEILVETNKEIGKVSGNILENIDVLRNKINNFNFSDRNYFLNSNREIRDRYAYLPISNDFIRDFNIHRTVTMSVYVSGRNLRYRDRGIYGIFLCFVLSNGNEAWFETFQRGTEETDKLLVKRTWTLPEGVNVVSIKHSKVGIEIEGDVSFYNPKLELSSKATPWTPAPEDFKISVGGRNYIPYSKEFWIVGNIHHQGIEVDNSPNWRRIKDFINVSEGEYILNAKGDYGIAIYFYNSESRKVNYSGNYANGGNFWYKGNDFPKKINIPAGVKKIKVAFRSNVEPHFTDDDSFENALKTMKLERGTVATDWTPSIEDELKEKERNLNELREMTTESRNIAVRVEQGLDTLTNSVESKLNVARNEIPQLITEEITNRKNELKGVGITRIEKYFLVSPNNTGITIETTGWTTTTQTISEENKYLWSYDKTYFSDETVTNTEPIIIGTYGEDHENLLFTPNKPFNTFYRNREYIKNISGCSFAKTGNDLVVTTTTNNASFTWSLNLGSNSDNYLSKAYLVFSGIMKANKTVNLKIYIHDTEKEKVQPITLGGNFRVRSTPISLGAESGKFYITIEIDQPSTIYFRKCSVSSLGNMETILENEKKIKLFESNVDSFRSEIGSIKTKISSNYKNICAETNQTKTGSSQTFNLTENKENDETYTIVAQASNAQENLRPTINGVSQPNIKNGINIWVARVNDTNNTLTINNLGTTSLSNVKVFKGDLSNYAFKEDIEEVKSLINQEKDRINLAVTETEKIKLSMYPMENLYTSHNNSSSVYFHSKKPFAPNSFYTISFYVTGATANSTGRFYGVFPTHKQVKLINGKNTFLVSYNTPKTAINIDSLPNGISFSDVKIYRGDFLAYFNEFVSKQEAKAEIDVSVKNGIRQSFITSSGKISQILINGQGTKIDGGAIVDNLYGKTITGGTITGATLTGSTRINIGQHGFMQPTSSFGLQINLPTSEYSRDGLGVQIVAGSSRSKNVPYGMFIYKDSDITTGGDTAESTDSYLLTVEGYIDTKGVGNIKWVNYNDGSTELKLWSGNRPGLVFDTDGNDIKYKWNGSTYGFWSIIQSNYNTSSDIKIKRNIKPSNFHALNLVNKFKFKEFDYIKNDIFDGSHVKNGLIAQEVEKIDKSLVYYNNDILSIDSFKMLNIALKAIQELNKKVEELTKKL